MGFRGWLAPLLLGALLCAQVQAQERFIDDTVRVPIRTGASTEHRIVQILPSGTAVTVVEEDRESGWTLVRTRDGREGWMPGHYLKRDPVARYQLAEALRQLGQPDDGSVSLNAALTQLREQLDTLARERDRLQAELAEGRQLWSNADELDANNRQLTEEVQTLKNRIDVLEAEKRRLSDDAWQQWFINGVWATGVGGFLTLMLPRLFQRRKRYSEWA